APRQHQRGRQGNSGRIRCDGVRRRIRQLVLLTQCRQAADTHPRRADRAGNDTGRGDLDPGRHESSHAGDQVARVFARCSSRNTTPLGGRTMRDRRCGPSVSHDRWLVSYADFVTLLFAFFVVLYATAQVDKQKAVLLSDAIRSAFQQLGAFQGNAGDQRRTTLPSPRESGAKAREPRHADERTDRSPDLQAIRSELELALAMEIQRNDVALRMDADGLVVSLRE